MATLTLTTLRCERQQDVTGVDEPRIVVNDQPVWDGVIDKGQTVTVDETVPFADTARVRMEERNGSNVKQIGPTLVIDAARVAAGTQHADFKTSGAHYHLHYLVTS